MILYTPMQLELVFDGMEKSVVANQREISFDNKTLVVEDNGYGMAKMVRLISTDPMDYLNPNLIPGAEIKL